MLFRNKPPASLLAECIVLLCFFVFFFNVNKLTVLHWPTRYLFPCGDSMVCIIDDREDVWKFAPNLITVKKYVYFEGIGDISAPPGSQEALMAKKGTEARFSFSFFFLPLSLSGKCVLATHSECDAHPIQCSVQGDASISLRSPQSRTATF